MDRQLFKKTGENIWKTFFAFLIASAFWDITSFIHLVASWNNIYLDNYTSFNIAHNIMMGIWYILAIYLIFIKKIKLNKRNISLILLLFITFFSIVFVESLVKFIQISFLKDPGYSHLAYIKFFLFNPSLILKDSLWWITYGFWILVITWVSLLAVFIKSFKK